MKKIISVLFLLVSAGFSQAKVGNKFGKGILNVISDDSCWSIKFGVRFQTLFVGDNNLMYRPQIDLHF